MILLIFGLSTIIILLMSITVSASSSFLEVAKNTGIDIVQEDNLVAWRGETGGNIKSQGPLSEKKIGVIIASEFSDFQAYYLASYIGEFGGLCEFLLVDWVKYKFTRPNVSDKGVRGMWGLSVDPIPVGIGNKASHKNLKEASPSDYDALIIIGGHSADVMVTEQEVIEFITEAHENDVVLGAIGEGIMPFVRAGVMDNKTFTGSKVVQFMLEAIGDFVGEGVVTDENLITAKDTVNTPDFVRALCKYFDSDFDAPCKDILQGKKILIIAGEDYEDIELIVPTLEYFYRGAEVILGTFPAPKKARPNLLGLDVVTGNFGTSIPFQDIPDYFYRIKELKNIKMSDFDVVQIPGAFCPWNIVESENYDFVKEAYSAGKIIAAICHGPIVLSAANIVKDKVLTGWSASKDAVEIMGGTFKEEYAAIIDGKIITGRTPPEIPELVDAITYSIVES